MNISPHFAALSGTDIAIIDSQKERTDLTRSPDLANIMKPRYSTVNHLRQNETKHRERLHLIGQQLGVKHWEDWYHVQFKDLEPLDGKHLIQSCYNRSLPKAMMNLFPEHPWVPWKFSKTPKGFWTNIQNQRVFMDNIATQLNIKHLDDWYKLRTRDVIKFRGMRSLLHHYSSCLSAALSSIYPEHNWELWRFERVPPGYWNDQSNIISYVKWLEYKLNLSTLDDWNNVSPYLLSKNFLFRTKKGLHNVLSIVYPHYNWKRTKQFCILPSSKIQLFLKQAVSQIFAGSEILLNYHNPKFVFSRTNREMELDLFVKDFQLAFEYQGEQHFHWHPLYGSPESQKARDEEKRIACCKNNITLIEVPYWWNKSTSSLMATISQVRPDLVSSPGCAPIPSSPPFTKQEHRPSKRTLTFHPTIPYTLRLGPMQGSYPKCRGCDTVLTDRTQPRVEIRGSFTPVSGAPIPARFSVCATVSCIETARERHASSTVLGIHFPPFEHKIVIPKELAEDKQIQQVKKNLNQQFSGNELQWVNT